MSAAGTGVFDPALAAAIERRFGLSYSLDGQAAQVLGPTVPRERLVEFACWLKDEQGYGYLSYVTAAHHPALEREGEAPAPAHYVVVYRVRNLAQGGELPFRCRVEVGTGVPSLFSVWAGADWQERETYDLVGPVFEGHPDLRRIMLPEDWEGHPLHRDYAIDTPHRPWR